ncbi:MAG: ATP-dependent helicase HrpB [Planctomycetes bacterium]|nr:ATP-dependent helicase HrpB [Planctomycetota bacterium]
MQSLSALPIDAVLPDLLASLRAHPSVVLQAPTGAGKTTRVPPALLDAGLAERGRIVVLEPRRLAARAAARRMSFERGTELGREIGYQVRFDAKCGRDTRIVVVTPGILLRMLHDDPFLESIAILVFDEFHERGLDSDLALGMARLVQQTVRPDLRLIVMSATLVTERVSAYLGGCPIIASEGRLFPVDIHYDPRPPELSWPAAAARAVGKSLRRTPGDVLVFLPGMGEIRQTARELEPLAEEFDLAVLPLHGDLPPEQQDAALLPQPRRKVVLSTNVAETSVTVEGVTVVVDTGLARQMLFDPAVGLDRLELMPISQASAEQRTGRAGRLQPGTCVRLWSEVSHRSRPAETDPEIRRVDVSGAVLQLLALGEKDPANFQWLDAPPISAVAQALSLLRMLGSVDTNGLTELGGRMAQLPVHPRLARLLIEGKATGCPEHVALAAALLSERDPFMRGMGRNPRAAVPTVSDIADRVEVLGDFERSGRIETELGTLHHGGASFVLRSRDQLLRMIQDRDSRSGPEHVGEELARALFAAFPDRLTRRRNHGGTRGVMVGGRGVKLLPSSRVLEPELFLSIDVDAGETEALVRLASGVRRDWLPPDRLLETTVVEFNPHSEKIEAKRLLCFEDLQLDSTPVLLPDGDEATRVLVEAALKQFDKIRPAADTPAGQYLLRAKCLREWLPELGLPAFDESDLRETLTWLCAGCRSFADLRKADWLGAIHGRLTHAQRQAIEREVPETLEVPSGSQIKLVYEAGRPPVLAVRIQEMFGLADTPRVAGGRVKVLLHLLAPNYRPQQVTEDLASFWVNTYPTVRKELRSRYPKHSWPDNPLEADALRGPKRRSS